MLFLPELVDTGRPRYSRQSASEEGDLLLEMLSSRAISTFTGWGDEGT